MSLFSELKQRGVFQAGVAYAVVAWLLVQVASIVFPAFAAPDWAMQATIILLLIGFPISMLVAWFYDLTSEGFQRAGESGTPHDRVFPGQALNTIIISVLAAAVVLFALDKFVWQTPLETSGSGGPQSLAVLPFNNLGGTGDTDPFAAGIHDDLLTQLSKISALRVISRTSVMRFRNQDTPIPEIARQLGVTAVLEGAVQRSEDRIRINAQLIDGHSDVHLWAETYDRQLTAANIFAIQSEISQAIAAALRTRLTESEQQALAKAPTDSLPAWESYAVARASMGGGSRQDLDTSISHFQRATELDPGFSAAWAGLCQSYLGLYRRSSNQQHFDHARAACERASGLDPALTEVHIAMGTLYRYFGQYSIAEVSLQSANYAKAEAALHNALELDATRVEAILEMGQVLARQGRLAEAEAQFQQAEQLEPASWHVQSALYSFYYTFSDRPDRFERAAGHAARGASLRPDLESSWNNLGAANYMLGRYELAGDAWQRSLDIEPNRTALTNTGLARFYSGRFDEAVKLQRQATELAPDDHRAMGRLADALRVSGAPPEDWQDAYRQALQQVRVQLAVNDRDWRTLGMAAFYAAVLGEPGARDMARRAIDLSDGNAETRYYLALVEVMLGDPEAAITALAAALDQEPDYRNLAQHEPDFAALRADPRLADRFPGGESR